MRRNLGTGDRLLRMLVGFAAAACTALAPLPLGVRIATFGLTGAYLLFTAVLGSCLGYRLMGKSTCAIEPRT